MCRSNPIKQSSKRTRATLKEDAGKSRALFCPPRIRIQNGKPLVVVNHSEPIVDKIDGKRTVVGETAYQAGSYLFPGVYLHTHRIKVRGKAYPVVGKTRDIRYCPKRGWIVYLEAVLRDESGKPILLQREDGEIEAINMSGWFLESELVDGKIEYVQIRPGKLSPSKEEIVQATAEWRKRIREK